MKLGKMTVLAGVVAMLLIGGTASADIFGAGANQFSMDFVTISGGSNPASGYGIVNHDYRMGTYEITNDQWNKFKAAYGTVTGSPSSAYDSNAYFTGANVPANMVSWYEAAQFVNWLNTSTGHQPAYKFTGTQGTAGYTLAVWSPAEAAGGTNLYRNKDAFYYLPTDDEWVKAAYWNGTTLQSFATKAGETLSQGTGNGTGWNYYDNITGQEAWNGPWNVGTGSQELNGTYDMMGNAWEWMENPYYSGNYGTNSYRMILGGASVSDQSTLESSSQKDFDPSNENTSVGFRVASNVPEPASLALLTMGGLAIIRRKRN